MAIVKIPRSRWCAFTIPLLLTAACHSFAENPRSTVADLRYGTTLYEYYQGNYFEALSELMVAEARGGIQGHGDNPKLIEGGISLSFGMEEKAGDIFSELLAEDSLGRNPRPLEVRNAAWFYLGKLRYLRGDWDGTEESFSKIRGRFDRDLRPELEALLVNLAIRRNNLSEAESILQRADYVEDWRHYLYYNLGNAYSRAQRFDEAIAYYNRLVDLPISELPSEREEQLVLYDRAMTAAGYGYILKGEADRAIEQFTRVRLNSPFSHRALLGYGWAAAEIEDYRLALSPWEELRKRPLLHAATQEAYIAVPFAYEQLGASGQALQAYLAAETAFEQEIARIDEVVAQVNQLDMLSALNIEDVDNRNWFFLDDHTGVRPHLSYLAELFSLNHFQGSVQELRDLIHMQELLNDWQERLDAYNHMLEVRAQNRQQQESTIEQQKLDSSLARMQTLRDQISEELERINATNDFIALADEDAKELYDIVLSAEKNLVLLQDSEEPIEQYEEQVKRYKGLLLWEASESFSERSWDLRSQINELDKAILEAQGNLARLNREILEVPDIGPYRARIDILNHRLAEQRDNVESAVLVAENTLRLKVTEELAAQKQRLHHYMSQARLAVARLYDTALQERTR